MDHVTHKGVSVTYSLPQQVTMVAMVVMVIHAIVTLCQQPSASETVTEVYCTSEQFNVRCPTSQVILIQKASYGRLRASRCITSEYTHAMGCYSDVSTFLDDRCSGRNDCSMLVATIDSIAQPCAKDFKSYLEVTYRCETDCQSGDHQVPLTSHSGYIGFYAHPLIGSGTSRHVSRDPCPWTIRADPGQRINMTWRITSSSYSPDTPGSTFLAPGEELNKTSGTHSLAQGSPGGPCPFHILFSESDKSEHLHKTCKALGLEPRLVYRSKGHEVQVQILGQPDVGVTGSEIKEDSSAIRPFIIRYQADGCSNALLPRRAVTSRTGDDVAIICNESMEVFYITCQGNSWVGEMGNCSNTVATFSKGEAFHKGHNSELKQGIVIAVAVGVVLGLVVGCFLLVFVFVVRKSRSWRELSTPGEYNHSQQLSSLTASSAAEYQAFLMYSQPYPHCPECVRHGSLKQENKEAERLFPLTPGSSERGSRTYCRGSRPPSACHGQICSEIFAQELYDKATREVSDDNLIYSRGNQRRVNFELHNERLSANNLESLLHSAAEDADNLQKMQSDTTQDLIKQSSISKKPSKATVKPRDDTAGRCLNKSQSNFCNTSRDCKQCDVITDQQDIALPSVDHRDMEDTERLLFIDVRRKENLEELLTPKRLTESQNISIGANT